MKISIHSQILDGNLGDGWEDDFEAACGLAEFTEQVWRNDLKSLTDQGYQLDITISVAKNTSGCSQQVSVWCKDYDIAATAESLLTDDGTIWCKFCGSDAALKYIAK